MHGDMVCWEPVIPALQGVLLHYEVKIVGQHLFLVPISKEHEKWKLFHRNRIMKYCLLCSYRCVCVTRSLAIACSSGESVNC